MAKHFYVLIVLCATFIACVQILSTELWDSNRWKGGGMGMFSDIYDTDVTIIAQLSNGDELEVSSGTIASREFDIVKNFPTEKRLATACSKLSISRFLRDKTMRKNKSIDVLRTVDLEEYEEKRLKEPHLIPVKPNKLTVKLGAIEYDGQNKNMKESIVRVYACW